MNKKTYDLAAFDMDGTLLDSNKQLRQDSLDMIHEAVEAGKVLTLSTGRCMPELQVFEEALKEVQYYICVSGALVYDNYKKEAIISSVIPDKIVREILELTKPHDLMHHLLSWDSLMEKDKVENIERYHMTPYKESYQTCCLLVDNIKTWYEEHPCPIFKLNLYCKDLEQRSEMEKLLAHLDVEFAYSEETNLELSPSGVSKAEGLRRLCKHVGVSMDKTIAVGDGDNDLEILKAAALSVAMANANEHVKAIADVVVASCDEGGCAQVIRNYLLNR